jgi:4-carboxymuconolactone decarboxylase
MNPTPRLPPLPISEWHEDAFEALNVLPGLPGKAQADPDAPGERAVANGFATLAHYPKLMKAFLLFNLHLGFGSTLSANLRELLVLRAAWLFRGRYVFVQHAAIAKQLGFTDTYIEKIKEGPGADGLGELDAAALCAVDELEIQGSISDDTWSTLDRLIGMHGIMDLIFTVGAYATVAKAFNSCRVPLEPDLAKTAREHGF